MAFTIEEAALVSLFVQSGTYGFFASLFAQSTSIILARHKKSPETRRVNAMLLAVSILMFLLSTVYVSTTLYRHLHAFKSVGNACGQVSAQLGDLSSKSYLVGTGVYGIQTVLGDGFMIYRTYMIWGGYLPVCIPAILTLLVSTVSGITFMFIPSHSTV
ncbi:hypothetical protein D9619_003842 [Psilocybe cf. subviscida]|uniref:Uncharacterized protein n=1 Tax=Psilocybe cf. subviscida TaxID=2480587 RepID=A0A8H5ETQ3_9AGAR|nr:hypothetical protein D9619_003842 [Psilocybe cf. subviscida]